MSTIGFVGLGAMGSRVAGRLLDAGHELYGNDRTRSKAEPLIERGLQWCDTPREVAGAADVIFSSVTDDAALDAITSGPSGILAGLAERKIYVDMSTVSPRASRQVAERVSSLGAHMLDAQVSGSIPQAESGTSAILGSPMLKARVPPLLDLPEQAWLDVAMMQKDIRLARSAAAELAIPLPSAAAADEMLTRACDLGYAHRDLAALHEVLAKSPAA